MPHQCADLATANLDQGNLDGAVVHESPLRVDNLAALKEAVQAMPQVPMPVDVAIVGDAYIRAGWVKAGTVVVGHVLNEAVPLVLLVGEALIAGDSGSLRVSAPYVGINEPGTRRALYAITDCYALNAIFTNVKDAGVVECRIIGEQSCLELRQPLPLASPA